MEEGLVEVASYMLNRSIINDFMEAEKPISAKDIENDIQKILRDNNIECKTKIEENWEGSFKEPRFELYAKVYVQNKDYEIAKKIVDEYISNNEQKIAENT